MMIPIALCPSTHDPLRRLGVAHRPYGRCGGGRCPRSFHNREIFQHHAALRGRVAANATAAIVAGEGSLPLRVAEILAIAAGVL